MPASDHPVTTSTTSRFLPRSTGGAHAAVTNNEAERHVLKTRSRVQRWWPGPADAARRARCMRRGAKSAGVARRWKPVRVEKLEPRPVMVDRAYAAYM